MHSHFTMTFPSLHFATLTHPSHPYHSLLHFISLHFWMISPTPSLPLIYHFPNPFPRITWFTETVPKAYVKLYLHPPYSARSDAYSVGREVGAGTDISKVSGYSIEDLHFSPHQQIKKHPCPHRVSFPSMQRGQICTVKSVYFSGISGVTSLHTDLGTTLPSSFTFMIVPREQLTPSSASSPAWHHNAGSHRGGPCFISCQIMWDLWSTKWHWNMFSVSSSGSLANSHSRIAPQFSYYWRYILSILTETLNSKLKKLQI
jgi:hypothetical protein